MNEIGEKYKQKGVPKTLSRLQPMILNLKAFEGVIGTFTQSNPEIANLVWGSMRVLLEISVRYLSTFTLLVDGLAKSANLWPRFQQYRALFPKNDRIEKAIAKYYAHYITFCGESIKFFKHRPLHAMVRFSWSKEEMLFENLNASMKDCKTYLHEEANAAHIADHQSDIERLARLIKRELPTTTVKLPCRRIPFAQNPRFYHRHKVFDLIDVRIRSHRASSNNNPASILLYGLGGIGKTQIAMHFAYTHWDSSDAVIWIGANGAPNLVNDYSEAAKEMSLTLTDDRSAAIAALRRWFEETDKPWILIFDNVEDPQILADYWPRRGASGTIVVTSRARLQGSNLVRDEIRLEPLDDKDSGAMLRQLLNLQPGDAGSDKDTEELAAQVHGVPLAISQIAGFISQTKLPISSCVELYKKRENAERLRSTNTGLDQLQYQHTLDTVFGLTFDKLNDNARSILDHCALLDPDAIPQDIFTTPPLDLTGFTWNSDELQFNLHLSNLFEYSLLQRNVSNTSLNIHREVQYSAIQTLAKRGDDALSIAFSNVARVLYRHHPRQSPLGEPIPDWDRCEKYSKHVFHHHRIFVEHCASVAPRDVLKLLTELYCDCGVYLWARGFLNESEVLAKASIAIADDILEQHDCLRAQPRTLLGCILMCREGQLAEATRSLQEALTIREDNVKMCHPNGQLPIEIDIQLANSYNNLGILKRQALSLDEAAALNEQSMAIKRKYPKDQMAFLLALSHHNQGQTRLTQNRIGDALTHFRDSVSLMSYYSNSEMLVRKAKFLYTLGSLEMKIGDVESAETSLLNALNIRQQHAPNSGVAALTSHRLGVFYHETGELDKAE